MSSSDFEETKEHVVTYLKQQHKEGITVIKSKQIAAETGISTKRVGTAMAALEEQSTPLEINRWGGDSNGTKWSIDSGQS